MSRKGALLSTETKELIITLSESVKNKAELSRMLNIPRTITRVVYYVETFRFTNERLPYSIETIGLPRLAR